MRILVTAFAIMALAAAPCAWDTDPREASAIAALFAAPAPPAAAARRDDGHSVHAVLDVLD